MILIIQKDYKAVLVMLAMCLIIACVQGNKEKPVSSKEEVWQMVWNDEFEVEGLVDTSKWSFKIGDGCPELCGWGNNELQYYTDSSKNARIEKGHLIIEAHQEPKGNSAYSSARMVTAKKGDWKYGRIEARASLPSGIGTWPAIWMLPTDWKYGTWPKSGEIDIMEHVGYVKDTIYGTVHTDAYNHMKGTQKGNQIYIPDAELDFHVYAIEWDANKIDFFVDGQQYHRFKNDQTSSAAWPFDQDFHLVMNLAVGGNWGGAKGVDKSIWPQKIKVDYVRVYQK